MPAIPAISAAEAAKLLSLRATWAKNGETVSRGKK